MDNRNIVIISLDEVRPDHLSCYGYRGIQTRNIDCIAQAGVRFETCITSSELTPIAMGSVITGKFPNHHGMRDPFCYLNGPSVAEILTKHGFRTAGFVGNGLLARQHGFAAGFDFWNEASKETSWLEIQYPGADSDEIVYEGNYWVERFFEWLRDNHKNKFFVWGHLYETHEGSESLLLKRGLIKEHECDEFGYYDAKIKMADERLIGRLLEVLEEYKIIDDTVVVVMSDHGTNLGEHPAKPIPWRKEETTYPQHTTMYDHDLKVTLIMKAESLPKGKVVDGMVGSVDVVPTILDMIGISSEEYEFDGKSLLGCIKTGRSGGREIYSEDLFEPRGEGAIQSIRSDSAKFIRNLTLGTEAYYDLNKDCAEKNNLASAIEKEVAILWRKKLNGFLRTGVNRGSTLSEEQKRRITERLRALGYVK